MSIIRKIKKRGDTLIEVTFAMSVFALISILSLQIMDRDVAMLQASLESEMAKTEIDAQAEALRFIQNAFLSEREMAATERQYQNLWLKLSRGTENAVGSKLGLGLANLPTKISGYRSIECDKYYKGTTQADEADIHTIFTDNAFIINTRKVNPADVPGTIVQSSELANKSKFVEAPIQPRTIYTRGTSSVTQYEENLSEKTTGESSTANAQNAAQFNSLRRAEGIWVIAARDYTTKNINDTPQFFDFHIRTCWYAPGHDRSSTISTTIRLYNPEFVEDVKVTQK